MLRASHVCHHWRDVLTSSPRLWSELKCKGVALTLHHLTRSHPVPINVIADVHSDVQAVIALGTATDRFRSLSLLLSPPDLSQVFNKLVTPAPALENLEVSSALSREEMCKPDLPTTFLGGSMPTLKSLHLEDVKAQLNPSDFPALKSLHLGQTNIRLGSVVQFPTLTCLTFVGTRARLFDMSELFQVLKSAMLLEEVSVEFSGPTTPVPENQAIVELPRMRKLSFSNTFGRFPKRLLSLLVLPSVKEVELRIELPRGDPRIAQDFLPPQLENSPPFFKVDDVELRTFPTGSYIRSSGPGGVVSVFALFSCDRPGWFGSLKPIPIADVKNLTLGLDHPVRLFSRHRISESFRAMNEVRSLVINQSIHSTLIMINALSPPTSGSILFPRLKSITLDLFVQQSEIPRELENMARARYQAGFPLSEVSLDSSFPLSSVKSLKPYVECVKQGDINTPPNS